MPKLEINSVADGLKGYKTLVIKTTDGIVVLAGLLINLKMLKRLMKKSKILTDRFDSKSNESQ